MGINDSINIPSNSKPVILKLKLILSIVSTFLLITAGAFYFVKGDKEMSSILFIGGLISLFASAFWLVVFSKKK